MSIAGLEGSFSRMRLDQAHGALPVKGDVVTVRVMTQEQEQEINQKVQNVIDARQRVAVVQRKVADAQAGQAQARQMQQEARTNITQAKANMTALDAETVKNLDGMVGALSKMQEVHKANPANVAKIDVLRQEILQYRNNLPADANARKEAMAKFKQQATVLVQGLKK